MYSFRIQSDRTTQSSGYLWRGGKILFKMHKVVRHWWRSTFQQHSNPKLTAWTTFDPISSPTWFTKGCCSAHNILTEKNTVWQKLKKALNWCPRLSKVWTKLIISFTSETIQEFIWIVRSWEFGNLSGRFIELYWEGGRQRECGQSDKLFVPSVRVRRVRALKLGTLNLFIGLCVCERVSVCVFPWTKAGEVADRSSDVSFTFPNSGGEKGANYHLNARTSVCVCALSGLGETIVKK